MTAGFSAAGPREQRLSRGAFCVSIDVELAWGYWDRPRPLYLESCRERERRIVGRLLALFEEYGISATWAIVGALLSPEASGGRRDPAWFAPDVVDAIRSASVSQEIGSHSFGHIYFSEASPEAAEEDLARARATHEAHGLEWESFVFPRNLIGHLDELARQGIRVFRGRDRRIGGIIGSVEHGRRLANLIEKALPIAPAIVQPLVHPSGIVEIPGSMLLMGRDGLRRVIRPVVLLGKARSGLLGAIRRSGIFHLWFHPSNFYVEEETQLEVLSKILMEAAAFRDAGELDVLPMQGFARMAVADEAVDTIT